MGSWCQPPHTYVSFSPPFLPSNIPQAYVYTKDEIWKTRLNGFLNATSRWFPNETKGIMFERCERTDIPRTVMCNGDQFSFKAYFTRWLTVAIQLVPDQNILDLVVPRLQNNAKAAARVCTDAAVCGSQWYLDSFDNRNNVGSQMSALAIIQSNLYKIAPKQVTASDGGSSKGNPATGTDPPDEEIKFRPLSTGDRAGAAIVTLMVTVLLFGGAFWLVTGE
jgi:mannan endo-1,6-alpha-mannosidase